MERKYTDSYVISKKSLISHAENTCGTPEFDRLLGETPIGSLIYILRYFTEDNKTRKENNTYKYKGAYITSCTNILMKNKYLTRALLRTNKDEYINFDMLKLLEDKLDHEKLFKNIDQFHDSKIINYILEHATDINKIFDNGQLCLSKFLEYMNEETVQWLVYKDYNFNFVGSNGNSLLDYILLVSPNFIDIGKLLAIDEFDITSNCRWIYIYLHGTNFATQFYTLIPYLLERKDYASLLYNITKNYTWPTAEDDIIVIINFMTIRNIEKVKKMIDGNYVNIIHEYDHKKIGKYCKIMKLL